MTITFMILLWYWDRHRTGWTEYCQRLYDDFCMHDFQSISDWQDCV